MILGILTKVEDFLKLVLISYMELDLVKLLQDALTVNTAIPRKTNIYNVITEPYQLYKHAVLLKALQLHALRSKTLKYAIYEAFLLLAYLSLAT